MGRGSLRLPKRARRMKCHRPLYDTSPKLQPPPHQSLRDSFPARETNPPKERVITYENTVFHSLCRICAGGHSGVYGDGLQKREAFESGVVCLCRGLCPAFGLHPLARHRRKAPAAFQPVRVCQRLCLGRGADADRDARKTQDRLALGRGHACNAAGDDLCRPAAHGDQGSDAGAAQRLVRRAHRLGGFKLRRLRYRRQHCPALSADGQKGERGQQGPAADGTRTARPCGRWTISATAWWPSAFCFSRW